MSTESEQCLAELCSSLQYLTDRGETSDTDGAYNLSPVQSVRYTNITTLPHVDVFYKGHMIRLEATDLGPHVHEYDDEGTCEVCHHYDEDHDVADAPVSDRDDVVVRAMAAESVAALLKDIGKGMR